MKETVDVVRISYHDVKDVIITDALVIFRGLDLFKVTKLSMEGAVNCTQSLPAKMILFYILKINCVATKVTNQPYNPS